VSVGNRYWDSNNFLAWLNQESNFAALDALIRRAREGHFRIVTSTIVFSEVYWIRGEMTEPAKVEAIRALFDQKWLVPIELDRTIGDLAGELMREFARREGLRPIDAIHLASAIRARQIAEVVQFDTWEGTIRNLGRELQRIPRLRQPNSGGDLVIGIPAAAEQNSLLPPTTALTSGDGQGTPGRLGSDGPALGGRPGLGPPRASGLPSEP
jgi:predicted nucleic acid-binding protein